MAKPAIRQVRRRAFDPDGQLLAARVIAADPSKAKGCSFLIDWAQRLLSRTEHAEPSCKGQLTLLDEEPLRD